MKLNCQSTTLKTWKNYREVVLLKYHEDELNVMPSDSILATVKIDRSHQSELRKKMRGTKDAEGRTRMKEQMESIAFGKVVCTLNFDNDKDNLKDST